MQTQYIVRFHKIYCNQALINLGFDSQAEFQSLDEAAEFVSFCNKYAVNAVPGSVGPDYTIHCARIVMVDCPAETKQVAPSIASEVAYR